MRRLSLLFAAAALLAACRKDPSPLPAMPIDKTTFAPILDVQLAKSVTTPSGLVYRDLAVGSGAEAVAGKTVLVHYDGRLADGTQFDENAPGDDPLEFALGQQQVIAGWDEGVSGMKVGGKRQLVIPPALGYGDTGIGPIPGNAILVFTVELVAVR